MQSSCFHCLEIVPKGFTGTVEFDGKSQPVCCIGCQAVAQTIISQGMTDYYKYRSENASKVEQLVPEQLAVINSYDDESIQADFVHASDKQKEITLSIEGISCAACAWLIEKQLLSHKVSRVNVNTATHRATIAWHDEHITLSQIIKLLAQIGYKSYPFQADQEAEQKQRTAKAYLRRLGVAGLMTMQVMMFAFAMYFGMFTGMEEDFEQYFRWISLILATPVILYSALPFLNNAITGLKHRQLNMDLPVAIAIFGTFAASCIATLTEQGEVYFESICMFTFLLLLGKYLEFRARLTASEFTTNLQQLLPLTARKVTADNSQLIAVKQLKLNDTILIKAGETIPADGVILKGETSVDESMMTGEHHAVKKRCGDQVHAGTINHDGAIEVNINKIGKNTLLNQIISLQNKALETRPQLAQITDKVAQWFVACLLVFATLTAVVWYQIDPQQAFWITIAVLVATCPCALSLAIPTALTCAVANLTKRGILIKQGHVLETATKITRFAFDKTGTLTEGRISLSKVTVLNEQYSEAQITALAASLEQVSEHPIARAFSTFQGVNPAPSNIKVKTGYGISADWQGKQLALGKADWFNTNTAISAQAVLFIDQHPVASFEFDDQLRPHASEMLNTLKQANISRYLLTGDSSNSGVELAQQLQLDGAKIGCLPQDKQQFVQDWTHNKQIVAMVGDGVNDSPVFNSAHLSIAMESGADISKNTADVVLLNSDLRAITHLLSVAKHTRRITRQNLAWALCYNGAILPLAACGLVAPWMAVIGMSASSILVITNSLRLLRL